MENNVDDSVKSYAHMMQYKLELNKHKACPEMNPDGKGIRGWDDCDLLWLHSRLLKEAAELHEQLKKFETNCPVHPLDVEKLIDNIRAECADVGNFAMMIYDNISKMKAAFQ